jgi:outer membrane protein OmpA-like peptidoglycan-associated protein
MGPSGAAGGAERSDTKVHPSAAAPPVPFALGSTVPQSVDEAVLASARACGGTLVVTGHSCWLGPAPVQQSFGLARAVAVRDWLVARGVDGAHIRVASAGARQPIAPNTTRAGRRANRRVTLTCSSPGGDQ